MESLQLSQVLADLSNLGAAVRLRPVPTTAAPGLSEPEAAAAIVSANTSILAKTDNVKTEPSHAPQLLQRPSSGLQRSWSFDPNSQPKVDKFGRRIHVNTSNSRSGSTTGSIPGTPRHEYSTDDDLERASTLMALYEIRSKLKQQDNSSLIKAREKINALAAKQQAQQAAERNIKTAEELKRTRFSFPKPGL
ncbi:hypothetical protein S40285_00758 [Stachybotrys chlorohalonatus IBT 40285]|uniref:Uncharacterized protein n=1 Tax=Stachybotrys chlorohalonatus (strain IBT 40285) TaxID=1283841 RepID=A0A084QRC4_STAC4|nr:hypothetical protein S40285_00758 [Stachybotrys chlorohalonata IBT 40285]